MPEETGGVRDHLANERTQLAWLRTGAAVMVVGLALARFADEGGVSPVTLVAGGLLVLSGAATIGYGTWRYRRLADELRHGTATRAASSAGPTVVAGLLVLTVVVSSVLLLVDAS